MEWVNNHWSILIFIGGLIGQWVWFRTKLEELMEAKKRVDEKLGSIEKDMLEVKLTSVREQQKVANIDQTLDEVKQLTQKTYDLLVNLNRRSQDK